MDPIASPTVHICKFLEYWLLSDGSVGTSQIPLRDPDLEGGEEERKIFPQALNRRTLETIIDKMLKIFEETLNTGSKFIQKNVFFSIEGPYSGSTVFVVTR